MTEPAGVGFAAARRAPPSTRNCGERDRGRAPRRFRHATRSRTMRITLLAVISLLLGGCQTWGPTWSEITGARYPSGAIHQYRRPAIIEHIDDQGSWASDPIKVEPGKHRIVVQGPTPRPGGGNLEVFMLDVEPCKRYYINTQFRNNVDVDFQPVIDYVEAIAGCTIVAKQ
jgi:hypothetical protein